MDGENSYEPEAGRTAPDDAESANSVVQTFLYAMPGALDLIVCEEAAEQPTIAA